VVDWPRFSWRGVHLDVCRHFMPKSFLLKMIDLAAFHKCNIFHLHLTEDQGWRIPIDRYPRLVEIGAWRRESASGHEGEGGFDGVPHGGYYTKDDLREVVAFAAERHVTVVPEVDMPGHMTAAIASYPELGNTGRQLEVATGWGVFDHILNLEESTIEFCTDVIEEVLELFPGPYFHAGGDECPTVEWEANGRARRLMEEHEMDDARQLQAWFTARIAAHVEKRGRTLVGWHEILLGGAPPSAVVAAWREEGVGAALAAGHDVVMAPENWLYFDWAYSNDPAEPLAIRGAIPVERVYSYDPAPISLPEDARERVLGTQCQLWTEYVPTPRHAEYMYFPRLCALAEVAWSPSRADGSARSYEEFERRLDRHLERLAALDVNYRPLSGPTPGQARLWRAPY
jgi:hexosaminidase